MRAVLWASPACILAMALFTTASALEAHTAVMSDDLAMAAVRRHLLAPKKPTAPVKKPATQKLSLLGKGATTKVSVVKTGTGKNVKTSHVLEVTGKGATAGTKLTATGFAVTTTKALTLTAAKGVKKVKGTLKVAPKLAGAKTNGANAKAQGAKLKMRVQKASKGRRLSATCDTVPILVSAYYDMTCAQLNLVLASLGQPPSKTCTDPPGQRIFIASVQYNISSIVAETFTLPDSFNGFTSLDISLLDASCGTLVIESIDISISDGILNVTPTSVPWASGMVAAAVGNNKIAIQNAKTKDTFDVGGKLSTVIKGLHRFNSLDELGNIIAVNLLVCKYSTFELANIAINSDGTHRVVDTFVVQDEYEEPVQPIKAICYSYGYNCKIQAYRSSDDSYIMLTYDSYDILARSGTVLPFPKDSQIMDGALGGFATAGDEQIVYGSDDSFTQLVSYSDYRMANHDDDRDTDVNDFFPEFGPNPDLDGAPAPAPSSDSDPTPDPEEEDTNVVYLDDESDCADIAVAYKNTRRRGLVQRVLVACGGVVVEYGQWRILQRNGGAQTRDGSRWAAIVDVDSPLGTVYNNVKANYVGVTSKGRVTAFRFGGAAPVALYTVTPTAESAGVAVIELPAKF